LKRIILLVMVGTVVAAIMAASSMAVGNAQEEEATGQTDICAPWSEAWDISKGDWYYQDYRWCYDPWTSDPADESSWYTENGDWQFWDKVNMCPDSGTCTVSTG
jgi:hypothetical protein